MTTTHLTDQLTQALAGRMTEAQLDTLLQDLILTPTTEPALLEQVWQTLVEHRLSLNLNDFPLRFDCCGSGGSGLPHFNTSTVCSFVLAAAGVPVIKFGNRAATSQSGGFDFLDALGLTQRPMLAVAGNILSECNLLFLYAPQVLPGLAHLAKPRRRLGQKTVFNLLGPLLNPAKPTHQLLGISEARLGGWVQEHLKTEGITGWVVCGHGGQDDITPWGDTHIWKDNFCVYQGLVASPEPWPQWDKTSNVAAFHAMLDGRDHHSLAFQQVYLNAGAALWIAGQVDSWQAGQEEVVRLFRTGRVAQTVKQVQECYARYTG